MNRKFNITPQGHKLYKRCLVLRGEYFNGLSNADVLMFLTLLKEEAQDEGELIRLMAEFNDFLYPREEE